MSFTVFLGNLPAWVTADDIKGWLSAENLVADAIKVIRNPETQESKGFAFIESPNTEEMNSIIRRFDRAPLEDRLLRANPAQPPKSKGPVRPGGPPQHAGPGPYSGAPRGGQDQGSHGPMQGMTHGSGHGPAHGSGHGPVYSGPPRAAMQVNPNDTGTPPAGQGQGRADQVDRPPRRGKKSGKKPGGGAPQSAFAEELAKVL